MAQVQDIVARAGHLRVLGARHSFNTIADSTELLTLADLPPDVVVDRAAGTVTFNAGLTYGALASALEHEHVALANLPSLAQVTVAGAVATATHGSGAALGCLATSVAAIELVDSGGELVRRRRGEADFDGLVVSLGCLGAVVRLTLDVEPAYDVRQRVFEGLRWATLLDHFDEITSASYSVSLFTRWGSQVDQIWLKARVTDAPEVARDELFGAVAASGEHHPVPGMDPVNCTPQLGRAGRWSARLPHFRLGFTPSTGHELQSEYLLPRAHALAAIEVVRGLADTVRPVLQVCEIRTVAADHLWMSPQYGRESVAFHFTWQPQPAAVDRVLDELEAALAPFDARPHWGKLFRAEAPKISSLYERMPDFIRLAERLDRRGAFRNAWSARHLGIRSPRASPG